MRRDVCFWGRYSLDCIGTILAVIAVLEGISLLFGYSCASFGRFVSELRVLLTISAAAILFFLNTGAQTIYIPLLLSHGETRKAVFIGHTAAKLTICAITVILSGLLALMSGEAGALRALPTETLILLIVSAFGGIAGTLCIRHKWIGTAIFVIACGGLGISIGLLTGFSGETEGASHAIQELMQFPPLWLYVLAAVLAGADLAYHWAVLRRREVRL